MDIGYPPNIMIIYIDNDTIRNRRTLSPGLDDDYGRGLRRPDGAEGCAPSTRCDPWDTDFVLVEAGGVEPPSEKARREENYVRIRLIVF